MSAFAEQWTQPLWPSDSTCSSGHSLLKPGTVDRVFEAWPVAPALSSVFKGSSAYAFTVFSTASSLYCKQKQALTFQCFAADAASAAVAVATTCFWDATWPHVLVVHPVHACDLVQLAAWIASG